MLEGLRELFGVDWAIFMDAARVWLHGGDPYGPIGRWSAGAFAYPPTALPWLAVFSLLGPASFGLWLGLQLVLWWRLIRRDNRGQLQLLVWVPLLMNLYGGQSTLAVVLALWAATRAERRSWGWGVVVAWALTKPQVALLPALWLVWQDRRAPDRWRFAGAILLTTLLLALPATIARPLIWSDWLHALTAYRGRILQMAPWQGWGLVLLVPAAYLWWRSASGGWQWWLTAAIFPSVSTYSAVVLLPVLRPRAGAWPAAGLALAGVLQGPITPWTLPLILAGHLVAAWCLLAPRPHGPGVARTKGLPAPARMIGG